MDVGDFLDCVGPSVGDWNAVDWVCMYFEWLCGLPSHQGEGLNGVG